MWKDAQGTTLNLEINADIKLFILLEAVKEKPKPASVKKGIYTVLLNTSVYFWPVTS